MFKNFKKKSLKAKIAIIAVIVILLSLVVYVLHERFKPEPPVKYEMAEVTVGSITDYLDVSGTVKSGYSHNYIAIEGVRAEAVKVSVGDEVKKGDLIATFDVSGAAQKLVNAKKEYDAALKDYNDAVAAVNSTVSNRDANAKAIQNKKNEIAAKEKEIAALRAQLESQNANTEMTSIPQSQIDAIAETMLRNGATEAEIAAFKEGASSITVPVVNTDNTLSQTIIQKNLELSQLNAELTTLQAESAVNININSDTYIDALKNVADSKKDAYDSINSIYEELKKGWYADKDGIITKVNLEPGEIFAPVSEDSSAYNLGALFGNAQYSSVISSLIGSSDDSYMGTGITLDSYEDLAVTVSVGKSDLLKIKKGMSATVTSLDSSYEAEIVYVAATATESDGLDLSSIAGSLMGSSGSGGAIVEVKIKNPDKNIVIGFDADVKIALSVVDDVLKVPVESILYDNGAYYVFVFDKDTKTVKKQAVTHGILDDTYYQIVSGVSEGDVVLKSPNPSMEDGAKVQQKEA